MKTDKQISRSTLDETPARALTFLRTAGTSAPVRRALAARGYTEKEHAIGWSLLLKCSSYRAPAPVFERPGAMDAIRELDAMDEGLFRTTRATLERLHPAQGVFLFDGIEPEKGAASVVMMSLFLDRVDALEASPERVATRVEDQAAIETLAARGLTATERTRLRGLIELAKNVDGNGVTLEETDEVMTDERMADLTALRGWFVDWAETAKLAVGRRDHLVRLGLAQRRKAKSQDKGAMSTSDKAPISEGTPV